MTSPTATPHVQRDLPRFSLQLNGTQPLESLLGREWLVTNQLGAYASSTVVGCNTRRYHGLLVAPTRPPLGRVVLLAKLQEVVLVEGRIFELSVNEFPDTIHPQGHQHLVDFQIDPVVCWQYDVDGVRIDKQLVLYQRANVACISYHVRAGEKKCLLHVYPLLALRDFHGLQTHSRGEWPAVRAEEHSNTATVTARDAAGLSVQVGSPRMVFTAGADWYYNFRYRREAERGQDDREDLFCPGHFSLPCGPESRGDIYTGTAIAQADDVEIERRRQLERRHGLLEQAAPRDELERQLVLAADQFIVDRPIGEQTSRTIVAGYPWFGDWGRDTFVSLPGLLLSTGRLAEARQILRTFAHAVSDGMIPNRFEDYGEPPSYNTVDAALWFIHAMACYWEAARKATVPADDERFLRTEGLEVCREILAAYRRGTRYRIKMDPADGLIWAGDERTQLTWMDAKCGEVVFTPRHGKPVEVNALWFNALAHVSKMAKAFGRNAAEYDRLLERVLSHFPKVFWNETAGCLYDCVRSETDRDAAVRPNQIFAVSLPDSPLSRRRQHQVVAAVHSLLFTPRGLRSLSPQDPAYRGTYAGGFFERDGAYHQGTVWGWLMGPYLEALLKVNDFSPEARKQAAGILSDCHDHLYEAGLGTISEIFDGDPPHAPRGTIAQAWSVAELLRVKCMIDG
jgi:predicted glycogen debranching enzyme